MNENKFVYIRVKWKRRMKRCRDLGKDFLFQSTPLYLICSRGTIKTRKRGSREREGKKEREKDVKIKVGK